MATPASTTESRSPFWVRLELNCDEAISLARAVASSLLQNARADTYVPLLKRQRKFVDLLRCGIGQLSDPANDDNRNERERLTKKMRLLIDLDERNHRHLTQRGARLNIPSQGNHLYNRAGR